MKIAFLTALACCVYWSGFAQEFKAVDVKKHITFLASDELEGRGTGSLGEIKAANYIADQFKELGLKPGGKDQSFFQPFQVTYAVDGHPHVVTGRNVIGFLDNGAEKTVVVGAHYDHLGRGYQSGSLSPDSKNQIHNGADDNASGTAGLIELARHFAQNGKPEKRNVLFMAFSGEELGLLGSKYFTETPTVPLSNVSAMINMDMIGRLDDSKGVIISGWGTSPRWGQVIPDLAVKNRIRYTVDSSGVGASDHTSFYLKNIPVLQFFTGTHGDYHKTSDDVEKINFEGEAKILKLIAGLLTQVTEAEQDPGFLTAGNPHAGRTTSNFKVTLGVMPDYSYQGKGLKIDGVSKMRPAETAGLQVGDVIVELAGKQIETIYDYMEVLGKYEKGQTVQAVYLRKEVKKTVQITF